MDRLSENSNPSGAGPAPLLRRLDQASVAMLLAFSLILIGISAWLRHRQAQGLIEIDRAPPIEIDFRVDVNQAKWPELALLPGVGETLARRIVESRDSDGPFLVPGDLLRVPGIGPVKLEEIAPYLLPLPAAHEQQFREAPLSRSSYQPPLFVRGDRFLRGVPGLASPRDWLTNRSISAGSRESNCSNWPVTGCPNKIGFRVGT
jgi:competence protein ComEA